MIRIISKFLASRLLSVVLMAVLAGVGAYVVHTIKQNARLQDRLEIANNNTEELNRRLAAEIAISRHMGELNREVADAPEHTGCPDPVILRGTIKRLHNDDSDNGDT